MQNDHYKLLGAWLESLKYSKNSTIVNYKFFNECPNTSIGKNKKNHIFG
jgi:hypothetical protein